MSMIRDYYEQIGLPSILIERETTAFDKHPDIKREFEHWLESKEYITQNCADVENYTAKSIAEKFPVLDGEGAFRLLVQLRDEPEEAHERINRGFIIR